MGTLTDRIEARRKVRWVDVVEVEANVGTTSGATFLDRARRELSVYGGMSSSEGVVNDEGGVTISFDPLTADGGRARVLQWLDDLDVEYTARFMRWQADR